LGAGLVKLTYEVGELGPRRWYAVTDDGNNDGSGATPLDAVCDLVAQIERDSHRERL
jgi:hypothetical protein